MSLVVELLFRLGDGNVISPMSGLQKDFWNNGPAVHCLGTSLLDPVDLMLGWVFSNLKKKQLSV